VSDRRRAAQLARHYREQENLTITEIARRLGRAEATVKAYLYDHLGLTGKVCGIGRKSRLSIRPREPAALAQQLTTDSGGS
jgi:transposase